VELDGEPHLIVVACREICPTEELLLNYDDRESPLPFLKKCPVCDNLGTISDVANKVNNNSNFFTISRL
jgi:hypothetical protein